MESYVSRATSTDMVYGSLSGERRRSMMEWRDSSKNKCNELIETIGKNVDGAAMDQKESLERSFVSKISLNAQPSKISGSKENPYQRCRNVFIDLGSNIGDSVGYFIDNAIDVCSPMWAAANPETKLGVRWFPRPHLNVTSLEFSHRGSKANPLFGLLQQQMKESPSATSESFCVYGMEGNPTFTERLTKLENFINDMNPRPIQHVHIFTESVVTATDGPTKLYLDKTSVEQNFWGSSILSSQQDAVKSANELNNGNTFSADVTGIKLSTMVQSTMMALKADATKEEQSGGLLIVKMDVEGAEYQVLKEVAASDILCKLTSLGNRVVFVVEYHNMSITDPAERRREKDGFQDAVKKIEACGVEFKSLSASWA
ncbi:unnamed protein product [Pseudo-nitzschia multistriata]|uniref:Methyltransferase FkbM domain-containing protein n=1 Tax=Pseudo-nitzschia multistriata TaxID=183589 RepID=A0A448Z4W9_9STRA|nr:unnamed protein product [Pseudo-nitzschia multistriata]